jgi:hypothetical protein
VATAALLLLLSGWRLPLAFNPDGVAYVRIASYWAEGKLDLAVNGYWGPMLSWLVAPWLGLFAEPVLAARVAAGVSALLFVVAGIAVLAALELRPAQRALGAFILALFTVSSWLDGITPDFLVAGLACLALAALLSRSFFERPRRQLLAGALFGAAYLAKAIALPFAVGVVSCCAALAVLCGAATARAALAAALRTLAVTAALSLPWILAISFEYGRPVLSTSASIAHAYAGPGYAKGEAFHPFANGFHVPEAGRVTTWEDPSRMDYAFWSPFDGVSEAVYQARLAYHNARFITSTLAGFDWLGLGLISVLLGFALHAPWRENLRAERWRWALVPVACWAALHLPVAAENSRYYYTCVPFLLAAGFAFLDRLAEGPALRWLRPLAMALVSACFLAAIADGFYGLTGLKQEYHYRAARELAERLRAAGLAGPVASVGPDLRLPLFLAFALDEPFVGHVSRAATPAELAASGARVVAVEPGSETDRTLAVAADFEALDGWLAGAGSETSSVRLYRRTGPAPARE